MAEKVYLLRYELFVDCNVTHFCLDPTHSGLIIKYNSSGRRPNHALSCVNDRDRDLGKMTAPVVENREGGCPSPSLLSFIRCLVLLIALKIIKNEPKLPEVIRASC